MRGWMAYWGRFYRTEMDALLKSINTYLMRWARKKYKRLRGSSDSRRGGKRWSNETPPCSLTGRGRTGSTRLDGKSGVTGDRHAPFRGSPGVRFPRATRHLAVGG